MVPPPVSPPGPLGLRPGHVDHDAPLPPSGLPRLRRQLSDLYYGDKPAAVRFRYALLGVDVAIIAFFIAAPPLRDSRIFLPVDYFIAAVVALELTARALACSHFMIWIRRPTVWVDLFVLATLLAPTWLFNLGFLRILRLWSVVHSEFFWSTAGRRWANTRWADVTRTLVTLVTFIFVVTGFVYTGYARVHPGINGYIDALYFTVATLTTTGFGDITLPGPWGKILSIVTMIAGITLFVRLAQTLFRPDKVVFPCPTCGLRRHDQDAVHCKACGVVLNIPDDGA